MATITLSAYSVRRAASAFEWNLARAKKRYTSTWGQNKENRKERGETLSISTHKKYAIQTYNIGRRGDIFVYIVTNHIFYQ